VSFKKASFIVLVALITLSILISPEVMAFPDEVPAEDLPGSQDHSLISRFPGSYIRYFNYKDYDEFTLPLNRLDQADFSENYQPYADQDLRLEGRMTQAFYLVPDNHSTLEIYRNYEEVLKDNGFEIIAAQNGNIPESFYRDLYSSIRFRNSPGTRFESVTADVGNGRYLLAKLSRAAGNVYISIYTSNHKFYGGRWPDGQPAVFQVVMEETDLKVDLINIDLDFADDKIEDSIESEEPDFPENVPAEDITDSRDHSLVSRFPNSLIRFYDYKNYDEFTMPLSSLDQAELSADYQEYVEENLRLEGKMTQGFYLVPDNHSTLEIFRNYEMALIDNGFEIIAKQIRNVPERFYRELYSTVNFKDSSETRFEGVNASERDGRYLLAKLSRAEGDVYISVYTSNHGFYGSRWPDGQPAVFQVVMEETDLRTDLIDVDSALKDLRSRGRVSIHGILFDVDSAQIREESRPTLERIAELLNENPELSLYVVGHTDNTGNLDYNIGLSERRAESVVNALISDYNIASNRLSSYGLGPLAPQTTNQTTEGREQNRRVELVKP